MRRRHRPLRIASRRSPLARAQAELVAAALKRAKPTLPIEFVWIESEGDVRSEVSLASAGGKGLFVRGIEQQLIRGKVDLAVHSLKDLPARDTPGLRIAAIMPREDVRDCLIAHSAPDLDGLAHGAVVGTASPRRAAQLRMIRPDLRIALIRGNIETRVRKILDQRQYDATLLAVAGLKRGGHQHLITTPLSTDTMLPCCGQGALAIQCRGDDHGAMMHVLPLNDSITAQAVTAERQLVDRLGCDCHSPVAVLVEAHTWDGPQVTAYRLRARVLGHEGSPCLAADATAPARDLSRLVGDTAKDLRSRGSDALVHAPFPEPQIQVQTQP